VSESVKLNLIWLEGDPPVGVGGHASYSTGNAPTTVAFITVKLVSVMFGSVKSISPLTVQEFAATGLVDPPSSQQQRAVRSKQRQGRMMNPFLQGNVKRTTKPCGEISLPLRGERRRAGCLFVFGKAWAEKMNYH
jgi:hypothetical protein